MIVARGFPAPPSYHTARLRAAPAQHFFDVITNGYGVMYSYAARVSRRTAGRSWPISAPCSSRRARRWRACPDAREKLP